MKMDSLNTRPSQQGAAEEEERKTESPTLKVAYCRRGSSTKVLGGCPEDVFEEVT